MYADCRILSIPLGPRVLLTKSPTAMAPTNAERRAFSPFSSVTSSPKICVGLKDAAVVAYRIISGGEMLLANIYHCQSRYQATLSDTGRLLWTSDCENHVVVSTRAPR